MINRPRAILTLLERFPDEIRQIFSLHEIEQIFLPPNFDKPEQMQAEQIVMALADRSRIPRGQWLQTLAHCNVFLALPGVYMPFSHNVVEAMAMGCIPLTNYGNWFDPPLEHMRTCIDFDTEDDLAAKVRMVLALDDDTIRDMRTSVIDYYDRYLAPVSFQESFRTFLEAAPTETVLAINTESAAVFERITAESLLFQHRQYPL